MASASKEKDKKEIIDILDSQRLEKVEVIKPAPPPLVVATKKTFSFTPPTQDCIQLSALMGSSTRNESRSRAGKKPISLVDQTGITIGSLELAADCYDDKSNPLSADYDESSLGVFCSISAQMRDKEEESDDDSTSSNGAIQDSESVTASVGENDGEDDWLNDDGAVGDIMNILQYVNFVTIISRVTARLGKITNNMSICELIFAIWMFICVFCGSGFTLLELLFSKVMPVVALITWMKSKGTIKRQKSARRLQRMETPSWREKLKHAVGAKEDPDLKLAGPRV